MFYGTNKGQVFMFPAYFKIDKKMIYQYYYYKLNSDPIEFLHVFHDHLFISDSKNRM